MSTSALTEPSPYDNSFTFRYKQAVRLGVPVKYLIIRPSREEDVLFQETFDLEDHRDAVFSTIFDLVRQMVRTTDPERPDAVITPLSLTEIWEILRSFKGDQLNPLDLPFIWLHAVPEYQIDNQAVFQQITVFLAGQNELIRYTDMSQVLEEYRKTWLPDFQQELERDTRLVRGFAQIQQEIAAIVPFPHSELVIDFVKVTWDYPVEKGMNPLADYFNSARTSYVVPFIQYNLQALHGETDTLERYYKIYKGRSIDLRPDYNNVHLSTARTSRPQSLYLNVWQGEDYDNPLEVAEEARDGKKDGFGVVTVAYLEGTNESLVRVGFESPQTDAVNENTVIDRLREHVPALPAPTTIREVSVGGSFRIYNLTLIGPLFFHFVMNDPVFSAYLYLEETGSSFAEKNKVNVNYRGTATEVNDPVSKKPTKRRASTAATLRQEYIQPGESFTVVEQNGTVTEYRADRVIPVINVSMTRASSRRVAQQFVDILSRFFNRYRERGQPVVDRYLQFVPEFRLVLQALTPSGTSPAPEETSPTEGGRVIASQESRIDELRREAPDLFVAKYARNCQKPYQPKIIRPNQVDYWRNQLVRRGASVEQRQVMSFPPNQPRYLFVCPGDFFPYPYLKENKLPENRHLYPLVPCCGKTDQRSIDPSVGGEVRVRTRPTAARDTHIITSDKILDPGRRGTVSSVLSSFLSSYDERAGEFFRYGTSYPSKNSFIHCVATAVNYLPYINAIDRDQWVNELRVNLFNTGLRPEALRQELYDMTNEDIVRYATDNDSFFDPLVFYRAMEAIFDCNIYIFARSEEDPDTGRSRSLLQIPRNRHFHVHPPNSGHRVVLIMRHRGSESDALDQEGYEQCELIVNYRGPNEIVYSYDDDMNDLIYPAMSFVGRTLTWQILESGLSARLNLYSSLNYRTLLGDIPIIGQIIDNSGKARMLALAPQITPEGSFTELRIFVNVPPTQPLNVPEFQASDASRELPPYQRVIEFFGPPSGATFSLDGQWLTGMWFPLGDVPFGLYCPVLDFPRSQFTQLHPGVGQNTELGSAIIHVPRGTSSAQLTPVQRARRLSRAAQFVDQLVKYLYLAADRPNDLTGFLGNILISEDPSNTPDSLVRYDVSRMPRILPVGTPQQILAALSDQPFVISGRIVIRDQQMLEGLIFQLRRFIRDIEGLPIEIGQFRQLQHFYATKDDFKFDPRFEFLLGSLREFNQWIATWVPSSSLQQRTIQNLNQSIQTQLNPNAFSYQEPYIYQRIGNNTVGSSIDPKRDRFYLIQNVAGGELKGAIRVALTWYREKRNTGFATPPYEAVAGPDGEIYPAHIVFGISPGGGVIVQQNNSQGGPALEILDYGNGVYAAMLPLL